MGSLRTTLCLRELEAMPRREMLPARPFGKSPCTPIRGRTLVPGQMVPLGQQHDGVGVETLLLQRID
jgi:hypothetical protein